MPPVPIGFQTYQSRSLPAAAQRLVNLYAEKNPEGGRAALTLYGTPGLDAFLSGLDGAVHHLIPFRSGLLAYAGNFLYQIGANAIATEIGEIPGDGPSYWAVNGPFLTMVRDGRGWTYGTPEQIVNTATYDSTPPLSIGYTPANGGTDVLTTADIIIGFSKDVRIGSGTMRVCRYDNDAVVASINAASVVVVDAIAQCPTGVTLTANTKYYVLAPDGFIVDFANARWSGIQNKDDLAFTTATAADTEFPYLESVSPAGGAEVPSGSPVYLYYNERVQAGVGDVTVTSASEGIIETIPIASCTFLRSILQIPVATKPGNTYTVSVPTGAVKDIANNVSSGASLSFSTLPADGRPRMTAINVLGPSGPIVLEFDREMTVTTQNIRLNYELSYLTATATAFGYKVTINITGAVYDRDYDLIIPPGTLDAVYGQYTLFPGFGTAQLLEIVDQDFLPSSTVASLGGYSVFTRTGTSGEWFISQLGEPQQFDALDYATADISDDPLLRAFTSFNELWLFGSNSVQVQYVSGDADFPISPVSGAVLEKGLLAPQSVAKQDNRTFWVGQEAAGGAPQVYVAAGYQPSVISTPCIARFLQEGDASNCTGFAYTQENHAFYVLNVPPGAGYSEWRTLVYDASEGLWHERQSGIGPGRWRANCYAYVFGRHFVGDWDTGAIYTLNLDTLTELGETIIGEAVGTYQQAEGHRFVTSRVELTLETGVGLTLGQGSDPQVMLQWSDDGARTWSYEHWRPIGAIGAFLTRVRWQNLGQSQTGYRAYKFRISDPVKRAWTGVYADVQVGKR